MSKPPITYPELRNKLEKGTIKPLYLFQGEEEFLMEEAIDLIKEKVLGTAASSFNFEKFYGKEAKADEIIASAEITPFLSNRRFLLVKDTDLFSAAELDILARYAAKPNPSTCLIFTANKIDGRKKSFFDAIKTNGEIVQFWKLFENEVPRWIQRRAKKHGLSLSSEACLHLYENIGNDLRQLDQELEKVGAFLGKQQEISLEILENVIHPIRQYSVFDLVDKLGQRKLDKTLEILEVLLREGEEPLKITTLLARQIRLLWYIKLSPLKGTPSHPLEKELGIPSKYVKNLQEQEKNFSLDRLRKAFARIAETDLALKSSDHTPRILLENLLLDIII
jgi:DNA polymerase-3 subunit delta